MEQEFRLHKLRHDIRSKSLSIHQSVDMLKHCDEEEQRMVLGLMRQAAQDLSRSLCELEKSLNSVASSSATV